MYDLNKVMLIGRLTKDPETRSTQSGAKVASFTLAMTMSKNKDTGEQKTEYIDCTAWEGLAGIVEQYVPKGTMVYVEGQIQTRSWEGQDGKKNYKTEVLVKDLKILSSKSKENKEPANQPRLVMKQDQELPDINDLDLDEIVTPF